MSADQEFYGPLQVPETPEDLDFEFVKRARVCLVYTGGTIGMVPSDPDNPSNPNLRPANLDELIKAVKGLGLREGIELGMVSFHEPVDSSDVVSEHWFAIGSAIADHYDDFDGFVVLHGTDTMAYTTSALSFLLRDLGKPVVVTGSQLPILHPRTDAIQNLTNAVYLAGYKAVELPPVPEVVLLFRDHVFRGNRVTKFASDDMEGFKSPNFPPLGKLGEHIQIREELLLKAPNPEEFPFQFDRRLAQGEIRVVWVNPTMTPGQLEKDLDSDELAGVILCTYGTGNMQTNPDFIEPIRSAIEKRQIPILNVTQCTQGMVEMGLYEASGSLLEAGVASGLDLTYESAITKLQWALASSSEYETRRNSLQECQCGEQSQSLLDMRFTPKSGRRKSEKADVVQSPEERIPGKYRRDNLRRANLRLRGLGWEPIDKSSPASLRVFINEPNASAETATKVVSFCGEVPLFEAESDVVRDVTRPSRLKVADGKPVSVTLVGINANIWCRSIHLSLYLDPIYEH